MILDRNSKADTALFLNPQGAGIAALVADIGQERTNLVNNTTYASEASSARTAIAAPREVAVVFDMTSDDVGVLVELSNAGSYSYRVRVESGRVVEVHEAGSLRASVQVDEMDKESVYKLLVHWSTRSVGAMVLSELAVYDYTRDKWYTVQATHASSTPSATDTLNVAAAFGGGNAFTRGPSAIYSVRIGRRFHPTTEAAEDWVSESTPPTLTARQRPPMLTYPSAELPIASEGQFAGPAYLWAGAATRRADMRLVTPLVNCVPRLPHVETNGYTPTWYFRDAFDSDEYHMTLRYLWHARVSPKTNKARCRIFVRVYEADGLPDICDVHFRMYSVANPPLAGQPPSPIKFYRTATTTVSSPNGTLGAWLDLGTVQIARDASGLTYFALAFSFGLDAGAPEEAVTRFLVRAVQIDPCYIEYQGNGFDADVGLGIGG